MEIRIINPDYGVAPEQMEKECSLLQPCVGPDVKLSMVCLEQTHVEIDSAADVVLAGPEILSLALQAEKDGCDAVVLYCFSDPALAACREILTIPVVGGAQASLLLVPLLARNAGVILADRNRIPEKERFLQTLGLAPGMLKAIAAIDFQNKSIWEYREEAFQELLQTGRKMICEQNIQCLILGCLSFLGLGKALRETLEIPVIDPAIAAVSLAESLVRQNLMTSKKAYPQK